MTDAESGPQAYERTRVCAHAIFGRRRSSPLGGNTIFGNFARSSRRLTCYIKVLITLVVLANPRCISRRVGHCAIVLGFGCMVSKQMPYIIL